MGLHRAHRDLRDRDRQGAARAQARADPRHRDDAAAGPFHERHKSKERLRFEAEYDCVARMRDWVIESGIASESQLEGWEAADKEAVEAARDLAWEAFQSPIRAERDRAVAILRRVDMPEVAEITNSLAEAVKG